MLFTTISYIVRVLFLLQLSQQWCMQMLESTNLVAVMRCDQIGLDV